MAEKKVSVRLSVEGGRQVRAELEGVGTAGAQGFGTLSSEMELANVRLASFARKAGLALAAVAAAAAAAGVAMIRSGLETVDAQAKLAQSLQTTVESIQTLTWAGELAGVSMGEIEQATKKLTTRLSEAAAGSGSAVGALERLNLTAAELQALPLDQRIVAIQEALNQFVPEAERAAVASDLFGDRAALAFLRIDPATLREAAQDVRDFGVAVSATDAAQIERTGDAIARLSLIWLGLTNRLTSAVAPTLERVATLLADMARATGPIGIAITALIDNLGRLATYVTTFVALLAGRWVAGFAAAAFSVTGLATALVILRGALIRTGIGALIVGAGELVYQFGRLVQGAGGLGEALVLMGRVAAEVWERVRYGAGAVELRVKAVAWGMSAAWSRAVIDMAESWNGFVAGVAGAMASLPGMSRLAGTLRAAGAVDLAGTRRRLELATTSAANYDRGADLLVGAATAPLRSLAALREAMTGTDGATDGAVDATDRLNAALATVADGAGGGAGGAGGGTAGAAAGAIDAVTEAAEALAARARSGAQSIAEMLSGIVTGGKSALDVLGDLLKRLADVQIQRAIFGLNAGGIGSGFFGMLGAALTPPSFAGGGYTGSGSRAGGLDGKGGFMALLHPQETVVDHLRAGGLAGTGRRGDAGDRPISIHVDVTGANGDRQIMAMVEAGVSRGLAAYDRQLPGRVDGISRDRRAR